MLNLNIKNKFILKIIESFIGRASIVIFSILSTFIIAKLYGAEFLGDYTYILTVISICMIFAKAGMDNGLIYYIPQKGNKCISQAFVFNFIISIIISLVIYCFSDNYFLRLSLPAIWLMSAEQIFFGIFRSEKKIKEYYFALLILGNILKLLLVILLYIFFGARLENLIISLIISMGSLNLIFLYLKRKKFSKLYFDKNFIYYSFSMIIVSIMGILMTQIDILMIGNMDTSKNLGIYKVATQLSGSVSLILTVFGTVFATRASELYHKRNFEELGELYKKSTRIIFFISLIVSLTLFLLGSFLLGCFGKEFLAGKTTLYIRVLGQIINSSVGNVGILIMMTGNQKIQMWLNIFACIINVILNYVLIPVLGINGAAISSVISLAIINFIGYFFIRKKLEIRVYGIV